MNPLVDPKAPPIALLFVALKRYGVDCLEWDGAILRKELETDYNIKISDMTKDKLMAAIEVLTSDEYENDFTVFEWISHLLADVPSEYGILNPLTVEELVKATVQVMLIRHKPINYHSDIRAYIGRMFHDYGFFKAPKIFATAIIPQTRKFTLEEQDVEKNKAIEELFDYCTKSTIDYMDEVEKTTL